MSRVLNVYTDGGARGNPGPAAIGVVVENSQGKTINQFGQRIGTATNNVAEYQAVIAALEFLQSQLRPLEIAFYLDSALVVNQLQRRWKIKQPHLYQLAEQAWRLMAGLGTKISFTAIPREKNRAADALVNQALDKC